MYKDTDPPLQQNTELFHCLEHPLCPAYSFLPLFFFFLTVFLHLLNTNDFTEVSADFTIMPGVSFFKMLSHSGHHQG